MFHTVKCAKCINEPSTKSQYNESLQLCLHNSVYFNYTFTMNEDETVCNIYVSCLAICVYKAKPHKITFHVKVHIQIIKFR